MLFNSFLWLPSEFYILPSCHKLWIGRKNFKKIDIEEKWQEVKVIERKCDLSFQEQSHYISSYVGIIQYLEKLWSLTINMVFIIIKSCTSKDIITNKKLIIWRTSIYFVLLDDSVCIYYFCMFPRINLSVDHVTRRLRLFY